MVIPSLQTQFYRERIKDSLSQIRYLLRDIGEMSRIRETIADDWEIEELTRAIIFYEAQIIEDLKGEIEHDQRAIRDAEKGRAVEGPEGVCG